MSRQTVMAFVAGSLPGVDGAKCVKMALVHDIAEAIVGDLTPHDPVTPAEKHAREAAAVEKMQVMLGPAVWASAGTRTACSGCLPLCSLTWHLRRCVCCRR